MRIVVKLGTKVLTRGIGELDIGRIASLCAQLTALRLAGHEVLVVSSGAVGLGMGRLGWTSRPRRLAQQQLCAAVGQSVLTETWQQGFEPHGLRVAQVLLTREDVTARRRHIAVRDLLEAALAAGIVPIINENDTISADELKFGDNDVLSALVASLAKAQLLVILSTAEGLIDPATGQLVTHVERITDAHRAMAGGPGDATSTGGMITKLQAAELACQSGCGVTITNGAQPDVIRRLLIDGEAVPGTHFAPQTPDLSARRRYLAFFEPPGGTVRVDAGAAAAVLEGTNSLLAKGCTAVEGTFAAGVTISVCDPQGREIARGRSAYGSADLAAALGLRSSDLETRFPEMTRWEVIHRDDLVVLAEDAGAA
ncbi:MAG: glutamate 5-kinase [Opitutales bacterium]